MVMVEEEFAERQAGLLAARAEIDAQLGELARWYAGAVEKRLRDAEQAEPPKSKAKSKDRKAK